MKGNWRFKIAEKNDDQFICRALTQISMPGKISLAFHRNPSFFTPELVGNHVNQTLIYQNEEDNEVAGLCSRSIQNLYVEGVETKLGYLSMLRILPKYRSNTILVRGNKFLRDIHKKENIPYYYTTILSDNIVAQKVLQGNRAGLPIYSQIGELVTYVISLKKCSLLKPLYTQITSCSESSFAAAYRCLDNWNKRYQLAPRYVPKDFTSKNSVFPDFSLENLYIYRDRGKVLGTLGIWDQQAFKQTVVADYAPYLKLFRPLYNRVAFLIGEPTLPDIGERIKSVYGAFISSENDNQKVFENLLLHARSEWSRKGYDYLLVGLSEKNKLSKVVASYATRQIKSKIYLVYWHGEKIELPQNIRIPHLEIATL